MINMQSFNERSMSILKSHFVKLDLYATIASLLGGIAYIICSYIPLIGSSLGGIVFGMMMVGFAKVVLDLYTQNKEPDFATMFSVFSQFGALFLVVFLLNLFIGLWSLLLVIPGIIVYYQYFFVELIYLERPDLSATEVLRLSKQMTQGHKGNLFVYVSLMSEGIFLLLVMIVGYIEVSAIINDASLLDLLYVLDDPIVFILNFIPVFTIGLFIFGMPSAMVMHYIRLVGYYVEVKAALGMEIAPMPQINNYQPTTPQLAKPQQPMQQPVQPQVQQPVQQPVQPQQIKGYNLPPQMSGQHTTNQAQSPQRNDQK